jgi:hypothetical protein
VFKKFIFLVLLLGLVSQYIEALPRHFYTQKKKPRKKKVSNSSFVEIPTQAASSSSVEKAINQDEIKSYFASISRARQIHEIFSVLYGSDVIVTEDNKKIINALNSIPRIIKPYYERVHELDSLGQKADSDDYDMFSKTAYKCDIASNVICALDKEGVLLKYAK